MLAAAGRCPAGARSAPRFPRRGLRPQWRPTRARGAGRCHAAPRPRPLASHFREHIPNHFCCRVTGSTSVFVVSVLLPWLLLREVLRVAKVKRTAVCVEVFAHSSRRIRRATREFHVFDRPVHRKSDLMAFYLGRRHDDIAAGHDARRAGPLRLARSRHARRLRRHDRQRQDRPVPRR